MSAGAVLAVLGRAGVVDLILPRLLADGNPSLLATVTPAAKVGVTLVLALLSWHLLEEPLLRLKSLYN